MMAARLKLLEKKYALGEKVILDPHVLNQVLWSMQLMVGDYVRNLTEMARKAGSLKEGSQPPSSELGKDSTPEAGPSTGS
jgi:hypothetical protein